MFIIWIYLIDIDSQLVQCCSNKSWPPSKAQREGTLWAPETAAETPRGVCCVQFESPGELESSDSSESIWVMWIWVKMGYSKITWLIKFPAKETVLGFSHFLTTPGEIMTTWVNLHISSVPCCRNQWILQWRNSAMWSLQNSRSKRLRWEMSNSSSTGPTLGLSYPNLCFFHVFTLKAWFFRPWLWIDCEWGLRF